MNLAMGALFVFVGCAMLAYAVHVHEAATPWEAFQSTLAKIRGQEGGTANATP